MLHAKLAPSSAARRVACPGSRALEAQYPEIVESTSAREGTAAHWVAQQFLVKGSCSDTVAPNGEPITKEMLEGADLYEYEIKYICKDSFLNIEKPVSISNIHPECWGTPDCWALIDKHLYIFDYKFGHGYVDVYENWQLLEYAAGIAQNAAFTKITMTIIQPRCYTTESCVRSWTLDIQDLNEYIEALRESESAAMEVNAPCTPSPECTYCAARHACKALQLTVSRSIDTIKSYGSFDLDSRQLGSQLKHLRQTAALLDAHLTGLEEQAKSSIMRGDSVPGFRLAPGQGREHWTKDIAEVITLGELMGLDLTKPAEAVTPAQARKIGIDDEILKEYSQRTAGKLKLVEETDAPKVFRK
jgi:hypothetical protein